MAKVENIVTQIVQARKLGKFRWRKENLRLSPDIWVTRTSGSQISRGFILVLFLFEKKKKQGNKLLV